MDNENSVTKNPQPIAAESAEKSEILTEKCSEMKEKIKDEAQHIFEGHRGTVSKPKTLTEACSAMKEESKDEAKRLVPDLGNHC
jgi:hypothetical protein